MAIINPELSSDKLNTGKLQTLDQMTFKILK